VQLRQAFDVGRRIRRPRQRYRLDDEAAVLGATLFLIDGTNVPALTAFLVARAVLQPDETVASVAQAGDGNMNCTLRVTSSRRTIIVKQGRPWVEKYPQIAAPAGRTRVEAAFYRAAARCPDVAASMPAVLDEDAEAGILVLEDRGVTGDFTDLYASATIGADECAALMRYLLALQGCGVEPPHRAIFANRDMRALNHEHIFRLPLQEANGLALDAITPGLQAAADALKRDTAYADRVRALGDRYLADGDTLVHGDFFPGSWLRQPSALRRDELGVAVIDPEFCFLGCGEFDFGVMLGHLWLAGQPADRIAQVERGVPTHDDLRLVRQFAGVEIMRRIVGVAQLPLAVSLETKTQLLERSRALVLG
jgi:5-methylthioribose kinase